MARKLENTHGKVQILVHIIQCQKVLSKMEM